MAFPFSQIPAAVINKLPVKPVNRVGRKSNRRAVKKAQVPIEDKPIPPFNNFLEPTRGDQYEFSDDEKRERKRVYFYEPEKGDQEEEPQIINSGDDDSVDDNPQEIVRNSNGANLNETKTTKTTSDAIIQTMPTPKLLTRDVSTQTEEDRDYEEYLAQRESGQTILPIIPIPRPLNGRQPPLKIGLSRPKGRPKKRRVFYPDEEPYFKPPAPAC